MHLSSTLLILASLALGTTAAATPLGSTNKVDDAEMIGKRACAYRTAIAWQGGGCKKNWGGKCFQKCKDTSGGRNCCPETISSNIINDLDCFPGYSTCECACATN
jgi:hypothetical protein